MANVLAQRRTLARIRGLMGRISQPSGALKMLNMQIVNDTLDQVIMELNKFAKTSPQLEEAIEMCQKAKEFISQHSETLIANPSRMNDAYGKSMKDNPYENFQTQGGGFDSGSTLFQKQKEKQDKVDLKKQDKEIEKKTDADLHSEGINNCRLANGEFC